MKDLWRKPDDTTFTVAASILAPGSSGFTGDARVHAGASHRVFQIEDLRDTKDRFPGEPKKASTDARGREHRGKARVHAALGARKPCLNQISANNVPRRLRRESCSHASEIPIPPSRRSSSTIVDAAIATGNTCATKS